MQEIKITNGWDGLVGWLDSWRNELKSVGWEETGAGTEHFLPYSCRAKDIR